MNGFTLLGLVAVVSICAPAAAQSSTYVTNNQKQTISWNDLVGKVVEVDGVVWGKLAKGIGPYLLLVDGQRLYLRNFDAAKNDVNGRLLRVAATLHKGRVEPAPEGVQGYSEPFEYFFLQVIESTRLEKIELDQLLPSASDWILAGDSAARALRAIELRQLQPYYLQFSAPNNGSKLFGFRIDDRITLVFTELDDKVSSVSILQLNDPSFRADDKTFSVSGFRLPPIVEPASKLNRGKSAP